MDELYVFLVFDLLIYAKRCPIQFTAKKLITSYLSPYIRENLLKTTTPYMSTLALDVGLKKQNAINWLKTLSS